MSRACTMIRWGSILLAAPLLTALAAAAESDSAADPPLSEGAGLYGMYCAACHGKTAAGDGPTAEILKSRPTDLRRLAARNDKTFPADRVREAIDGRGPQHGTREMPLWGLAFQDWGSDSNQEREVRSRIDALVAWIESIQR